MDDDPDTMFHRTRKRSILMQDEMITIHPDGSKTIIPMGAPHGPRIPADAALIWSRQKPLTPGWYAWRVGGKVYPYLTRIYFDGETLMADMRDGSWNADYELDDVSDREWFGPLPD